MTTVPSSNPTNTVGAGLICNVVPAPSRSRPPLRRDERPELVLKELQRILSENIK